MSDYEKYRITSEHDAKSDSDEATYTARGGVGAGAPAGYHGQTCIMETVAGRADNAQSKMCLVTKRIILYDTRHSHGSLLPCL